MNQSIKSINESNLAKVALEIELLLFGLRATATWASERPSPKPTDCALAFCDFCQATFCGVCAAKLACRAFSQQPHCSKANVADGGAIVDDAEPDQAIPLEIYFQMRPNNSKSDTKHNKLFLPTEIIILLGSSQNLDFYEQNKTTESKKKKLQLEKILKIFFFVRFFSTVFLVSVSSFSIFVDSPLSINSRTACRKSRAPSGPFKHWKTVFSIIKRSGRTRNCSK